LSRSGNPVVETPIFPPADLPSAKWSTYRSETALSPRIHVGDRPASPGSRESTLVAALPESGILGSRPPLTPSPSLDATSVRNPPPDGTSNSPALHPKFRYVCNLRISPINRLGTVFAPNLFPFLVSGGRHIAANCTRFIYVWRAGKNGDYKEISRLDGVSVFSSPLEVVRSLAISHAGDCIASGGSRIRIWRATLGEEFRITQKIKHDDPKMTFLSLAFSPDGRLLLSSGRGVRGVPVITWRFDVDAEKFSQVQSIVASDGIGRHLAFAPSVSHVASVSVQGEVSVFQIHEDGTFRLAIDAGRPFKTVESIAFHPMGGQIASASSTDLRIATYGSSGLPRTVQRVNELPRYDSVVFSPRGDWLAAASTYGRVQVFRAGVDGFEEIHKFEAPLKAVLRSKAICISPDGSKLLVGSNRGGIAIYAVE
jgi:WD40 repeat protein